MAVTIQQTAASSDLLNYLDNVWKTDQVYRGHGDFSPAPAGSSGTYDQWIAGNSGTSQSALLMQGDFGYAPPGGFTGTVSSLTFGDNLSGDAASNWSLGNAELTVTGIVSNTTFATAIYVASNYGTTDSQTVGTRSLGGFKAYFAEQGTNQIGTSGNDKQYSFAGNDTFTGGAGNDTFVFGDNWGSDIITDFGDVTGNNDIIDLTANTGITSFTDLLLNHSNYTDSTGVLTIFDGANTIQVNGYVGTDIATLVGNGSILV
ncbi:hypothetical protein [Agrobacterium sp. NPDC090273]|uniref:hypothetical protein n=1 Tax=Agrobacterium sp. NPDC090273 TaxID=3363919 RepID=UPI00383B9488